MRADTAMLAVAAREVMGEQSAPAPRGLIGIGVAAVLVAIAVAVGRWSGTGQVEQEAALARAPQQSAASSVAVAQPTVAAPLETRPATGVPGPEKSPQGNVVATQQAPSGTWLLPPRAALSQLWSLISTGPLPTDLCADVPAQGIACIEGRAQTWEALRDFDRPVALQMVTPSRFGASVLLLGIEDAQAHVFAGSGLMLVGLVELGPLWSGRYNFLWHPPAGFQSPLAIGDSNPVVAEVADLFARFDGQSSALAVNRFNAALKERVILFQRQHQLEDDGVVGVQTLLKLNEQLGIDLTAASARDRLEQATEEVVLR